MDLAPLSLKEAQLMRKPVIATNVGGNPEMMIDGKTGFLVEKGNYEQLVKNLLVKGGKLIGLWFPLDKDISEGGPPWATSVEEVKKIFSNGWIMESEKFSPLSIEPRKGREKLIVFRKV